MPKSIPGLVGILNLTPDSFSDGGAYADREHIFAHAAHMLDAGAEVIDVGAESTRPGATPLSHDEEWQRLKDILPELISICHSKAKLISLDTRHPQTARCAAEEGVDWINDVSGLADPAVAKIAADAGCVYVLMHSLSIPADPKQQLPEGGDPVALLLEWAKPKLEVLELAGIPKERIIFDPGLGFGKSAEHSINILKRVNLFAELNVPVLIGHSRKSFLKQFADLPAEERDVESAAVTAWLADMNVAWLRVHDVELHARTLRVLKGLR